MENEQTIDAAVEWLAKAQQLGFYNSNVARLVRAGAEAVCKVLGPDEDRSAERILRDLDTIHLRLLNKSSNINAETAKTYIARTKRLISDYQGWLRDPTSYKPTARRARGPAKAKRVIPDQPVLVFHDGPEVGAVEEKAATENNYRDHTLHLSTGKALLRIPASISADDVALLTLVIRSHGPATPASTPAQGKLTLEA
jgi:hypothetical protein